MDDMSSMKKRVGYLEQQAKEFRKLGDISHDATMRGQFLELADRCEKIAANIKKNIPIHERLRASSRDALS
jgi:hypothetical protein